MYWDKFYKKIKQKRLPQSMFANFVLKKLKKNFTLVDFGCGNGRDTFFFSKHIKKTIGIDSCKYIIKENNLNKNKKVQFLNYNIKNRNLYSKLKNIIPPSGKTIVYARFFLHTLKDNEIKKFLTLAKKLINKNGNIYVEYRTDKDKDNKKTFNNHYRNFINPKNLENILNKLNLKSIYFKEGRGMAKFKKEDAYVARNIIQLK
tara:strand:+ start:361 stop:969 length:609 start_codon:yes stop_codon:yes gene_type:complete